MDPGFLLKLTPIREQLQQKDIKINTLEKTVHDLELKFDALEQHGRRDSIRISGIPESPNDDTDAAVLEMTVAMKLTPPLQPHEISVSHRVGKRDANRPRQILVKLTSRYARNRIYSAKSSLKHVNRNTPDQPDIYINEDLTFRLAMLAHAAQKLKKFVFECFCLTGSS